jgi:hypothetical protein
LTGLALKSSTSKNKNKLNAFTAAHAAFNSAADATTTADASQRMLGIAAGAAKAGRLLLFADALMKWRGDTTQFAERVSDALAACASNCADVAAFDRVVRACVLLDRTCLPDTSDVQDCLSWSRLWCLLVATCTGSTVVNMPMREFIRFSRALVSPTLVKWQPALKFDYGTLKKAIMKAVTRRGTAAQHSYSIDNLSFHKKILAYFAGVDTTAAVAAAAAADTTV